MVINIEEYQVAEIRGSWSSSGIPRNLDPRDVWDLSLLPEGWLVRHHRKSRKRWFVPLHQSLPLEPTRLGTERLTVRFFRTGARMVTMD